MGHFHEDGTYCDHDHDGDANIIALEFDDNSVIECELIGIFEVGAKEYAALVPLDESIEEVFFYEYVENGEEFELVDIEDSEFDNVVSEFENLLEEMESFDDNTEASEEDTEE